MFLDSVSHMGADSRRRCCGCWCGRDHGLWDSFSGGPGSGMGMLLGSRTATRDLWSRAVFRMPLVGRRGPVGLGSGPGGARGGLRTG